MAKKVQIQTMRQEFTELRQAIASDIDERFQASEQRLLEGLTHVVVRQLETAQQYLDDRLQIHAEALNDIVTKAAEGYGGTLDGIQRELKDFRAEWRQKANDTDGALANHRGRIEAIEKSLPSR